MQSNRRRLQAGQSLVEAVVASAMLGITMVVALGTIDASIGGGRQAVRQAWAQCIVRETIGAIKQASWAQSYSYISPRPDVVITVAQDPMLQTITVTARDPETGGSLYWASFLKAKALAPQGNVGAVANLASGCPQP
jgi:hypothetical protein